MNMCLMASISNSNMNINACNSAIKAMYINSNVNKEYDISKNFAEKKMYLMVDRTYIYGVGLIAAGVDSYKKQEIRISAPLQPLFNNISVDLKPDGQSYSINKVWSF